MGLEDRSTLSIRPRVIFLYVALESTLRRLMLAVKGFANPTLADAMPVCTISTGKVKAALVTMLSCRAGIVTGLNSV